MRDEFSLETEGEMPPTLEDLAGEYDFPGLPDLYESRMKSVSLMEIEGISIEALGITSRKCTVIFSYDDDNEEDDDADFSEGFTLELVDEDSGETLISAYHGTSGVMPGHFDVVGGFIAGNFDENDESVTPWDMMAALMSQPADDGFPVPVPRGPYLH